MADKPDRKALMRAYRERKVVGGVFCVENTVTGKLFVEPSLELKGSENRFVFAVQTGSVSWSKLTDDWKEYGPQAFSFRVLEELEKRDDSTPAEFKEEVDLLCEMWRDKLKENRALY